MRFTVHYSSKGKSGWYAVEAETLAQARQSAINKGIDNPTIIREYSHNHLEAVRREGYDAVSARPHYAPRCPYQEDEQEPLKDAWFEGADEAGWGRIYTNGVLNGEL